MNEYKKFAVAIARQAGGIIKKNFSLGMSKSWQRDNSPVTETDLEVNRLLLAGVKKNFPAHNVWAEEQSSLGRKSAYLWVCDPVDGTVPFSHGVPICTFSLALVKDGISILGVVYDVFGQRLFVAEKNKGAYLNNKKIKVSRHKDLKGTVADCELFSAAVYDSSKLLTHLELKRGVKVAKLCSYIYASVLVAAGEFAFTVFPGNTVHDAAAVKVIVEEAGGRVTDLFGQEQRYDQPIRGLLVSNGLLHNKLVRLTKELINRGRVI